MSDPDVESVELDPAAEKKRLENKKKRERAKRKAQEKKEQDQQLSIDNLPIAQFFKDPFQLKVSKEKGRHVVATRVIPAGETVFETQPYASVILDSYIDKFCHRCFQTGSVMYQCSKCKHARFCSTQCMNAAASVHNLECECLSKLDQLGCDHETASLRMVIRLLVLAQHERKMADVNEKKKMKANLKKDVWTAKPGLCFSDVEALVSHEADIDRQQSLQASILLSRMETIMDAETWQGTASALQLWLKVHCNAHSIINSQTGVNIGIALVLPASYLNHSCRPNCIYYFTPSGTMIMRTLRPVVEGEEITYSYIDLYQPKVNRHRQLQQIYYISECKCERCIEPASTSPDRFLSAAVCESCKEGLLTTPSASSSSSSDDSLVCSKCSVKADLSASEVHRMEESALHLFQMVSQQQMEAKDSAEFLEEKLVNGPVAQRLHPHHYVFLNPFMSLIFISQDPFKKKQFCERILAMLDSINLEGHPETATVWFALGEAYEQVADLKAALSAFQKALAIRTTLYTAKHPETKKVANKIKDLEYEASKSGNLSSAKSKAK